MLRKISAIAGDTLKCSLLHRYPPLLISYTISLRKFFSSPLIHQPNQSRHESLCDEHFMIGNNAVYLEDLYSQWSNDHNSVHQVRIQSIYVHDYIVFSMKFYRRLYVSLIWELNSIILTN